MFRDDVTPFPNKTDMLDILRYKTAFLRSCIMDVDVEAALRELDDLKVMFVEYRKVIESYDPTPTLDA